MVQGKCRASSWGRSRQDMKEGCWGTRNSLSFPPVCWMGFPSVLIEQRQISTLYRNPTFLPRVWYNSVILGWSQHVVWAWWLQTKASIAWRSTLPFPPHICMHHSVIGWMQRASGSEGEPWRSQSTRVHLRPGRILRWVGGKLGLNGRIPTDKEQQGKVKKRKAREQVTDPLLIQMVTHLM